MKDGKNSQMNIIEINKKKVLPFFSQSLKKSTLLFRSSIQLDNGLSVKKATFLYSYNYGTY